MRISIVTPSYNQRNFIERTLNSVLTQLQPMDEYIIVDGASQDGTGDILESRRSELTHLIIEPDDGQAEAVAKGFALATGDVIAYLNSDDVLLPGAIDFVRAYFLEHPHVDAIYSHRVFIDADDHVTRFWILPPHLGYPMKRWDFIPQETCFWRRSLMDEVGGVDRSYDFALDYDLFVRMMTIGRFKRVHRYLAAFREHDGSKTSSLLQTVGNDEINRVRSRYGLQLTPIDRYIGKSFWASIVYPSAVFRRVRVRIPTSLEEWTKRRLPSRLSFPY